MAHAIITLTGSTLASLQVDGQETARVRFSPAIVLKSQGIAGVDASTRWAQEGVLEIREAEVSGASLAEPAVMMGGSMECGGFKYLDMVPLPLADLPGFAELRLRLPQGEVVVSGQDPRFVPEGPPRYLEHVRETQPSA